MSIEASQEETANSQPVVQKFSSDLTLHNSDHPNYVLATNLLNEKNYNHWRRSVEVSLRAKSKLGMVTGTCKKPIPTASDYKQWETVNNMVISWLLHSVEKDIAESVIYYRTASQIWKEFETRFNRPNRTRIFNVQREPSSCSQGTASVTSYFTKLKKLWDEYTLVVEDSVCECGSNVVLNKVMVYQQVIQFLMGLNESFNAVRANVLMITPSPSLNVMYQMIFQEEEQRGLNVSAKQDAEAMALAAQRSGLSGQKGPPRYCDHCKVGGHTMDKCWKLHGKPENSSGVFCDHCKIPGHTIDKCWKVHGKSSSTRKFFCDHCKVPEHSVERCWKVHGYPPGKGPRVVANASVANSGNDAVSLTQHQYDQLVSLLNKQSGGQDITHAAFLAGPFDEQAISDWS